MIEKFLNNIKCLIGFHLYKELPTELRVLKMGDIKGIKYGSNFHYFTIYYCPYCSFAKIKFKKETDEITILK